MNGPQLIEMAQVAEQERRQPQAGGHDQQLIAITKNDAVKKALGASRWPSSRLPGRTDRLFEIIPGAPALAKTEIGPVTGYFIHVWN